jgi:hypothetical protein
VTHAAAPDFVVLARPYGMEVADAARPFYDGVTGVYLNGAVDVLFVPPFAREPWPPAPADPDDAASVDEARRAAVASASYAVTPDDARAGTAEVLPRDEALDPEIRPAVVFYVGSDEFEASVRDLEWMADRRVALGDGFRLPELAGRAVVRLLLERVVGSEHFDPRSRRFLGA